MICYLKALNISVRIMFNSQQKDRIQTTQTWMAVLISWWNEHRFTLGNPLVIG